MPETLCLVEPTQVMCNMDSTPTYWTALWAICMLDVSESPAGLPAGCHVMSIKSGLPARILSSREMRLTAPDFVLGGKNSREKNLSLLSHLALIFSARVAPKLFMLIGDAGRELAGVESREFGCQAYPRLVKSMWPSCRLGEDHPLLLWLPLTFDPGATMISC